MKAYIANIQNSIKIPVGYVSTVDGQFHYMGDYLANPELLGEGIVMGLIPFPMNGSDLYVPVPMFTDESGVTKSILALSNKYPEYESNELDVETSNGLWDYFTQTHTYVISEEIYPTLPQITHGQYIKDNQALVEEPIQTYTQELGQAEIERQTEIERQAEIKEQERLEQERLEQERLEQERLEQERLEQERLEQERLEQERLRLEQERLEQERLEQERLEQEKLRLEQERLEQQRLEQEAIEQEALEQAPQQIKSFGNQEPLVQEPVTVSQEVATDTTTDNKSVKNKFNRSEGVSIDNITSISMGYINPKDMGDYLDVNQIEDELVAGEMTNSIVNYKIERLTAPTFIPKLYRYHKGIHLTFPDDQEVYSVSANMEYDEFAKCLDEVKEKVDDASLEIVNPMAYALKVEIETRLCRGNITIKEFLRLIEEKSPRNMDYRLVYDILKYYIPYKSPNGLYDNLFLLPYLMKMELIFRGFSIEEVEYDLRQVILSWSLEESELTIMDDSEDDYNSDVEVEYEIDRKEMLVSAGQGILRNIISDTLSSGRVRFNIPTVEGVPLLQQLCIAAVYGAKFYAESEFNEALKLTGWSIQLSEYGIRSYILGIPASTFVIVWSLGRTAGIMSVLEARNMLKTQSERDPIADFKYVIENAERWHYNESLQDIRDSGFGTDVTGVNPMIYLSEYNMQIVKYVMVGKEDGKGALCVGAVAEVVNVYDLYKEDVISRKYVFLPTTGSYFEELLSNNILIPGFLESEDDLKPVDKYTIKGRISQGYYNVRGNNEIINRKDDTKLLYLGKIAAADTKLSILKTTINKVDIRRSGGVILNKTDVIPNAIYDYEIIDDMFRGLMV